MVGKISIGKSLIGVLNYNENKVKEGHAVCLDAVGYGREANELSFYEKLNRMQRLTALNPKAKTNALHISLNFDPSEKPNDDLLKTIAASYMDKIGFGDQPYLIYRHTDAGHDHIHIMTTNIKSDGSRIDMHNIGMNRSGPATRELEIEFGLVKAEEKKNQEPFVLKPLTPINYGKTETKRAISNTVNAVIRTYRFTSLPEYNAALRQFNVVADAGEKGSRMQENKGLLYYITDEKGNKKSVGIKASSIYGKPTISELEKQFVKNEESRKENQKAVKDKIDRVLADPGITTKEELIKALHRQQLYALLRTNEQGRLYGATFVDNEYKVVFNGSNLGKAYSANALNERFKEKESLKQSAPTRPPKQRHSFPKGSKQTIRLDKDWQEQIKLPKPPTLFKSLLETAPVQSGQFKPQRKKRRRKRYHL
ncbi:relaxase/mobilization nuclease domain-containing protein [Mucilaginibacter paludis]|uniref:Relaxase/mobilization nuclease family protein n=1 Tax=Mucilaginibacter paludis DSM 18603 TaxID=714943 RepID=H1XZ22_9SPHI|nr:relaxase/mobilization nuclease domain-containing protein [Mucilaginibacter paludis]EHQ24607.1 Relaxase/mobilization nuclease family protein [Mucilaginibacter paludis DSM 18603]